MKSIKLRTENGKHIVTNNGRKITFRTLRIALIYIKLVMQGAFEKNIEGEN